VRGHFVEVMSGPGRAGLQDLPEDILKDLLLSEELETQSELQVFEVQDLHRVCPLLVQLLCGGRGDG
jgi:hypothetical protein